jgi:glycosyltransferase involved in cell wall biosynthesis
MFADIGGEMHAPRWAVPIVRRVIRWHTDRLVANSAATAQNLMGPLARHASIIPNAVRSAFFNESRSQATAREALNLPADDIIVGVPGTLRPMKGHLFFLEAIAPLLHRHPSIQVAITGEGDEKIVAQVKERVRELQIKPRVHFLGWISDMPAFYRACDIACIPSRAEPFGRTAIEAFAVGTPTVATAVGGLKDIVSDGNTGWLVPYGDRGALRDAVQEAIYNPDVRQKMSANARQVADAKYHEKVYKKRIVELVSDQVRQAPRTPPR